MFLSAFVLFCEQDDSQMWKHMLTKHGRHGQGARRDPLEVEVITDSFFVFLDMRISHTVNGLVLQYSAK